MELLELILEDSNLYKAIDRVVKNDGSGGIDKMSTSEGRSYFQKHKEEIKNDLHSLQQLVGGDIETPLISFALQDNNVIPIVNEEGKFIEGLKPSIAIVDQNGKLLDLVFGTVIFVGDGGEEFAGLNSSQMEVIKKELNQHAFVGGCVVRVLWNNLDNE